MVINTNEIKRIESERAISHSGTPFVIRDIITMGEKGDEGSPENCRGIRIHDSFSRDEITDHQWDHDRRYELLGIGLRVHSTSDCSHNSAVKKISAGKIKNKTQEYFKEIYALHFFQHIE